LKIPLHHKAVVSSLLTPRRRVASSAKFAVLKASYADVAFEDFTVPWQGALTWYYQLGQLDQGFFKKCYSCITHHFILACDRQRLASQHWAQFGGVRRPLG